MEFDQGRRTYLRVWVSRLVVTRLALLLLFHDFNSFSDAKNMARDVNEILIGICRNQGAMSQQQAVAYVKDLGQKSRYAQDVWS